MLLLRKRFKDTFQWNEEVKEGTIQNNTDATGERSKQSSPDDEKGGSKDIKVKTYLEEIIVLEKSLQITKWYAHWKLCKEKER